MAHEIYSNRFLANDGNPAWHAIGTVRTLVQRFGEALIELLNGARYSLNPVGFFEPETGEWMDLPEQRAVIFQDPANNFRKSFGIVGSEFSIIQPERIIQLLDPVLSEYPVHTAGLLRDGSSIFLALKAEPREVLGEAYDSYLTFDLSFEPGRTMKAYSTDVRTVCANTQALGLSQSGLRFDVSHVGDPDAQMTVATELVKSFHERRDFFPKVMGLYAGYDMNGDEITHVIESAFTLPTRPKVLSSTIDRMNPVQIAALSDGSGPVAEFLKGLSTAERSYVNAVARSEDAREVARIAVANFNRDFPEFAGSAYAVYNGITQTADWRTDKNGGTRGNVAERVAPGGPRWYEKVRAAEALNRIVGLN
jgi:hypothetical protein